MKNHFNRTVIIILIGLIMVLILLTQVDKWFELDKPQLLVPGGSEIGIKGPVGFRFRQAMDKKSVEMGWSISPPVTGWFIWEERTLWFYPNTAMMESTSYQFLMKSGIKKLNGDTSTTDWIWHVQVRAPRIIYLYPAKTGSDLWLGGSEKVQAVQLTHSGGRVYDFSVSLDGQEVAYSIKNDRGGMDLWLVDRDGGEEILFLGCGLDACTQPAWSVDSKRIAYSRVEGVKGNHSVSQPKLWTVEVRTGVTNPLILDTEISGQHPSWSPDGKRLSFFDINSKGIRVLDLSNGKSILLPDSYAPSGSWSGDGSRLIYLVVEETGGKSAVSIYEVNFVTESIKLIAGKDLNQVDYSTPALSPDGQWIAVGLRLDGGSYSQQLWLVQVNGSSRKKITNDFTYTNAAYSWSPAGKEVIYQRLSLVSSNVVPEVIVWNIETGTSKIIRENAALPAWIP